MPEETHDTTMPPDDNAPGPNPRNGRKLLLFMGVVIVTLSGLFFLQYSRFLNYRSETLGAGGQPPAWAENAVTAEQCVDEILDWRSDCVGVGMLCDAYVPDVMDVCLSTTDRTDYCLGVVDEVLSTRFGHAACERRDLERPYGKACAAAYRRIAEYCHTVAQRAEAAASGDGAVGPRREGADAHGEDDGSGHPAE